MLEEQVAFKSLPKKPAIFLPSDQSVQEADKEPKQPMQPLVIPQQQDAGAQAQMHPPAQGTGQIVIKYPDGHEETINVVNIQSVRQVAKAGQVIPGPGGALSASYPQTTHSHQVSTSSLPAALRGGGDDHAQNPSQLLQADPSVQQDPTGQQGPPPTPQPGASTSATVSTSRQSADDTATVAKKKFRQPEQKYQSHSAPTIAELWTKTTEPDPGTLYSIPILR